MAVVSVKHLPILLALLCKTGDVVEKEFESLISQTAQSFNMLLTSRRHQF